MQEYTIHIDKGVLFNFKFQYFNSNDEAVSLDAFTGIIKFITQNNIKEFEKAVSISANEVTVALTGEETEALTQREYRYNIDLSDETDTFRILKGDVKIHLK